MAESINFVLERSLSWESVKWRLEALRTGKSFGEIALLRSLRYKVQQVVLIQRETGSVLQYLRAPGEGIKEAELMSSMLTALGDFMTDSFDAKQSQELEAVDVGDFKLWVHYGPQTLLAGTILGTPPPELRNVFARENELIHQEFAGELASFNGDASIFDGARPHLQNCLLGQTDRPKKQSAWWLVALAAVLIALLAIGLWANRRNSRWNQFLARLQSQPGIVVTGSQKTLGTLPGQRHARSACGRPGAAGCRVRHSFRQTWSRTSSRINRSTRSSHVRANSSRRNGNWSSRWYCFR